MAAVCPLPARWNVGESNKFHLAAFSLDSILLFAPSGSFNPLQQGFIWLDPQKSQAWTPIAQKSDVEPENSFHKKKPAISLHSPFLCSLSLQSSPLCLQSIKILTIISIISYDSSKFVSTFSTNFVVPTTSFPKLQLGTVCLAHHVMKNPHYFH